MYDAHITFACFQDMKDAVREQAELQGMTLAEYMRRLILDKIELDGYELPR